MAYGAILNQKPQKKMLPEIIITPLSSLTSVTATSSTGKVYNGTFGNGVWTITVGDFDTYTISGVGTSETTEVVVDVCKQYEIVFPQPSGVLNDNSWAAIRYASDNNLGESLWSVGDAKEIVINGEIDDGLTLNNYSTYVFILGFNHNEALEGQGITFGGFKSALSSGKNICLIDSDYNTGKSSGLWFNMNNSNSNSGGWEQSGMRNNLIPQFKSCLESELVSVLKTVNKYTDNVGRGSGSVQSNVTATQDQIFLLSEFETMGVQKYANSAEQNYQAQYQYYKNGNSKVKYRHSATSSTANWRFRSVDADNSYYFCIVSISGDALYNPADYSYGFAPAFVV